MSQSLGISAHGDSLSGLVLHRQKKEMWRIIPKVSSKGGRLHLTNQSISHSLEESERNRTKAIRSSSGKNCDSDLVVSHPTSAVLELMIKRWSVLPRPGDLVAPVACEAKRICRVKL